MRRGARRNSTPNRKITRYNPFIAHPERIRIGGPISPWIVQARMLPDQVVMPGASDHPDEVCEQVEADLTAFFGMKLDPVRSPVPDC